MKAYRLTVLRPDRVFFSGEVLGVEFTAGQQREEIYAGHMPMLFRVSLGMMELHLPDDTHRKFATGDGMVRVDRDGVVILSDFVAWEERLETAMQHRQSYIDAELSRRRSSYHEYRVNKINMSKTFISLNGKTDHDSSINQ